LNHWEVSITKTMLHFLKKSWTSPLAFLIKSLISLLRVGTMLV